MCSTMTYVLYFKFFFSKGKKIPLNIKKTEDEGRKAMTVYVAIRDM